jgi:hypothetical protein
MRIWIISIALLTMAGAQAQQPAAPQGTSEQQARSYVLSAFMTGSAPRILSDNVTLGPQLRERLALPEGSDSWRVYDALIVLIDSNAPKVRKATPAEAAKFPQLGEPLFALDAGELTLLVRYDLQSDNLSFVEQLAGPSTPVKVEAKPIPIPERPAVVAQPEPVPQEPKPAPAPPAVEVEKPVVEAQKPEPAPPPVIEADKPKPSVTEGEKPAPPALQVVEPKVPVVKPKPRAKPAPTAAAKAAAVRAAAPPKPAPRAELLKPSGPCVIKPVMSDQDLVNCGATPR